MTGDHPRRQGQHMTGALAQEKRSAHDRDIFYREGTYLRRQGHHMTGDLYQEPQATQARRLISEDRGSTG